MFVQQQNATSDPRTTEIVRQSDAALEAGQPADAERLARQAVDRDGAYIPARLALGRALEAAGNHAEAAAVYAAAARLSPFSSGVSRSLRRVWMAPLAGFGVVAAVLWAVLRIVGRQFDQRSVLIGLFISAAVLIIGTLVVLGRQRRRFSSLSADDRRLVESYGGGLVAGPAPGRLMAVAVVIVLLSSAAVLFAIGTKPSLAMKVGDCFTLDRDTSIEQVSAIPCDLPHGVEVYAVVEDPAPPGAPYPGVDAVRAAAKDGCEAAYEPFVGAPYTGSSRLWINILAPEEPYWVTGVRTNWCALQDPNGRQTSGSARGSGG